jgi:hypothetical protein
MKRLAPLLPLALFAVLVALAWRTADRATSRIDAPSVASAVATHDAPTTPENGWLYDWHTGERRTYALELTSRSEVDGAAESESSLTLETTLHVDVLGEHEDGVVIRYGFGTSTGELAGVEQGSAYAMPMPQLEGHATYGVVRPDGEVEAWWVDRATDLAAQQLLEQIVTELQPRVALGAQWSGTERTALGDAHTSYFVTQTQRARVSIARTREQYTSLHLGPIVPTAPSTSEAAFVLEGGVLRTIALAEAVSGTTEAAGAYALGFTLRATLTSVGDVPEPETVAALQERLTRSSASMPIAERGALLARLRGMTPESMLQDLFVFGTDGEVPNAMEWMWRATALLTLQPELCADVVTFATDTAVEGGGHAFALQLLASVGHTEAQAALREVLSLPNVRSDSGFDQLVQRGVLVPELDEPTITFYETLAQSEDLAVNLTASNVLATAADQALARGDTERSAAIAARLVDGLESAGSPAEREARLRVLGNASDPSLFEPLLAASEASDPDLRGAAARGLRNQRGPEANDRLHALAVDEDVYVRRRALESMAERGMTASDWEQLTPALAGGAFQRRDEIHLLRALRSTPPGSAARDAALAAMLQMPGLSGRSAQELAQLRLEGATAAR